MSFLGLLGSAAGTFFGGPLGGAIGGALGGALDSSNAASSAATGSNAAAQQATALQRQMYQDQQGYQQPYQQVGTNALAKMASGNVMDYMDPGYQFRLNEGLKALGNNAKSRGGLISGNALKAAQGYGQSMASQEYQNAFNRLGTLTGYGQEANRTLANVGGNYANQAGQYGMTAAANAGNAGLVGAQQMGSAYTGIGNALGKYLNNSGGGSSGTFQDIGGLGAASAPFTFG